jgi:hypothetical protein
MKLNYAKDIKENKSSVHAKVSVWICSFLIFILLRTNYELKKGEND